MISKSKFLITGGAGFLGANLARKLANEGHEVLCLDNLLTGKMSNLPESNPNIQFENIDICEIEPSLYEADCIFHFASPASPKYYLKYPLETMNVASRGTRNALEIARINNARFIFSSTSEVYGRSEHFPQNEDCNGIIDINSKRAVYSESKRFAETMISEYRRKFSLDTTILRLFNTYGPFMHPDDGRVVSNFLRQSLAKEPLSINGDGSQTRSFCYVDDMISAILKIIDIDHPGPINIGNPEEISIIELGELIYGIINPGEKPDIDFQRLHPGDPARRCPDIKLVHSLTGWRPKIWLRKGLFRYIEWFKKSF
ncbi:MAG: NAD-dependent epimerase/dehydratase family protein [Candidatus Zixiibacteriota bacterium]